MLPDNALHFTEWRKHCGSFERMAALDSRTLNLTRRSRNQKRVYKSDSFGMATKPAWIKGHTALSKNILPEKTSIP